MLLSYLKDLTNAEYLIVSWSIYYVGIHTHGRQYELRAKKTLKEYIAKRRLS
jgi:hypothetical protein